MNKNQQPLKFGLVKGLKLHPQPREDMYKSNENIYQQNILKTINQQGSNTSLNQITLLDNISFSSKNVKVKNLMHVPNYIVHEKMSENYQTNKISRATSAFPNKRDVLVKSGNFNFLDK